jgi:uncharacterized protein (DUF58 family)
MTESRGPREPFPDRLIRRRCSEALRLTLRNLYILPSGFGWLWLLACAVLYLMGVGAASSTALLLAYAGLGLFLLAPFLTQFNLQGLELRCGAPELGFAGETVLYPLLVRSRCERLQLRAGFRQERQAWLGSVPAGSCGLLIPWTPGQRGLQRPGRLRLETRAPLGLYVCWTLWEPAIPQLIAPARRRGSVGRVAVDLTDATAAGSPSRDAAGIDEWCDLAPHRPEEGSGRIAWKQLARSGRRLSKRFSDPSPRPELLAPDPALPWEQALEHLSEHCQRLAAAGTDFGLEISGQRIEPARGERQLKRCLEALALAPERRR